MKVNMTNQEREELEFYRYFVHRNGLEFECASEFIRWKEKRKKRKTYLQDFLEKFPDAEMYENGMPKACRQELYGGSCRGFGFTTGCPECWNEEMPEDEK